LKKLLAKIGLGAFSWRGAPMERHFNLLAIHHADVWLNRDNLFALVRFSHFGHLLSDAQGPSARPVCPPVKEGSKGASNFFNNYNSTNGESFLLF
jgi:hypothetical protein